MPEWLVIWQRILTSCQIEQQREGQINQNKSKYEWLYPKLTAPTLTDTEKQRAGAYITPEFEPA